MQRRKRVEESCSDGSSINSSSENEEESYNSAEDSAGSLKDFIVQSDKESLNGKNCIYCSSRFVSMYTFINNYM